MTGPLGPPPKIRPGGNTVIYSEHWLTLEHLKVIWSWGEWWNTVSTPHRGLFHLESFILYIFRLFLSLHSDLVCDKTQLYLCYHSHFCI